MLKRILSLACCLSLTVGLFTYRPPEAKAIAIADDAFITAVILSVMAYGGYKLWVDNLDASAIADIIKPHVKQWNYEHGSTAEDPFSGFAEWATGGMDKFRKSITPVPGGPGPDMNGISWVLSFALFDKVCQFAEWLGNRVGVKPGVAEPVPIVPTPAGGSGSVTAANVLDKTLALCRAYYTNLIKESPSSAGVWNRKYEERANAKYKAAIFSPDSSYPYCLIWGNSSEFRLYVDTLQTSVMIDGHSATLYLQTFSADGLKSDSNRQLSYDTTVACPYSPGVVFTGMETAPAPAPSATLALPGTWSPTVPAEGTETVPMVIPGATPAGVLDVDALVREILNRVTKNELVVQPSGSPAPDPGTQPDTKPSINPGTDTEGLGLFGWLKRIWESIIALPAQIAEAMKNIFIPHEGYAAEFVADLAGAYQGRFGLLTYPVAVLADFVGTVATLDEQEPILRWNDVKWKGQVVIPKGEYNLKSAIAGTEMQTVYQVYRTVASAALIVGFIHLCIRKLREVQSN